MSLELERRHFVQLGLAAAAALALPASAAATGEAMPRILLHDLAVPHALALAEALPGAAVLQAVHGDPSTVLDRVLHLRAASAGRVCITGITREAAPFCLREMLGADADLTMQRIDGDLFLWTLNPARA